MCQTPNPWEARHSTETYRYKGQQFSLSDSEYSVCRECGFDVVLPHQKRQNEARIRDEHRRIDGLLTGPQIKAIRRRLGLTQAEAARLMGGGDNAFSKYERGEVTQSVAMNQLLLLLDARPDGLGVLAGRESSASVQSEHVLRPRTVQVPDAITERPIRHQHAKRVSVKRARSYPVERLAA
jgi:HTH-type transcriptional regulator/antitoxin MqsA